MRAVLVVTLSLLTALMTGCGGAATDATTANSGTGNGGTGTGGTGNPPQATAPAITAQPIDQSVTAGDKATFSVGATGSGLSYQWNKNHAPISGATSSNYTTPATGSGDDGASFAVVITNA